MQSAASALQRCFFRDSSDTYTYFRPRNFSGVSFPPGVGSDWVSLSSNICTEYLSRKVLDFYVTGVAAALHARGWLRARFSKNKCLFSWIGRNTLLFKLMKLNPSLKTIVTSQKFTT
jgi:hypothetical protein